MAPSYAGATAGAAMRGGEGEGVVRGREARRRARRRGGASALRELGDDWPTQARPNATDTGRPVPGVCSGS